MDSRRPVRTPLLRTALFVLTTVFLALAACAPGTPTPAALPRSSSGAAIAGTPTTAGVVTAPASSPTGQAGAPVPSSATSGGEAPSPVSSALPPGIAGEPATVVEVIDGDTVTVQLGGRRAVVRLIGVDAPESRGPYTEPECYAAEATATLQNLLARSGGQVVLERDRSEIDRYDRLLRYLWAPAGDGWVLLNEELVRQGAAVARRYPPDVKYAERLEAAQREAQAAGAGLWGACRQPGSTGPVTPAPIGSPSPSTSTERQGCDAAYPDVCIPPPPPDLDCSDVPYRRFRVLPPDPHRFDRDGDGLGCEG